MHHLVVGQGQDEVLGKGVGEGEGDAVVLTLAEQGISGHIVDHIVHPAHVPLKAKAQPAVIPGPGDHGEGGGFLGNHQHSGVKGIGRGVQVLEELHGLEADVAPLPIWAPLPVPAAVVQIEHGGHRVHPDAVDVVQV